MKLSTFSSYFLPTTRNTMQYVASEAWPDGKDNLKINTTHHTIEKCSIPCNDQLVDYKGRHMMIHEKDKLKTNMKAKD